MSKQQQGRGGSGQGGRGRGLSRGERSVPTNRDDRIRRPNYDPQQQQQQQQQQPRGGEQRGAWGGNNGGPQRQAGGQPQQRDQRGAWGGNGGGDGGQRPDAARQQAQPYSRRGAAPDGDARPVYERPQHPQEPAAAPFSTGRGDLHGTSQSGAVGTQVVREESRGNSRGKGPIMEVLLTRPKGCVSKCGTTGRKLMVTTNYFRILKTPSWTIYQYRVDFAPEIDMIRLRRGLLSEHKAIFGGYLFDGTVMFSTTYLEPKMTNGLMELYSKLRDGDSVQIKIKFVNIIDVNDIQQLQVNNLIMRRAMEGLKLQNVGRNLFDPVAKVTVFVNQPIIANRHFAHLQQDRHKTFYMEQRFTFNDGLVISMPAFHMEIWPGYTTSIRQHEQDVMLCLEIAHKVMRTDSVYSIFTQCTRENRDYKDVFKSLVCGTVVLTDYNNKTYRIDDVDYDKTPDSKFSTKDGEISFKEYYKRRYGLDIRDSRQPLLISRPTERNVRGGQTELVILIPEITRATGLTDAMRNNFNLMKSMGEHTRLAPNRRIERLRTFNQRLQESEASQAVLNLWNLRLDRNMVELPARVLNSETILLGNNVQITLDERADWQNAFRNNSMYNQKNLDNWAVIAPQRCMDDVIQFVRNCMRAAQGMRMSIAEPQYHKMPDDRVGSYCQAIENAAASDKQILMITLMSNNVEKYNCIKKRCCVDRPIPSQVVTMRTVAPRNKGGAMSIATKVVIQINAKLMGAPWMIRMPLKGFMTVGFDVCHSSKDKMKSFGALVATMDIQQSNRYYSAVMQHDSGQELSNEIAMHMTFALKAYRNTHKQLPLQILFYRDGVGDGQLQQVFNTEVKNLRNKLDEIYKTAGIETGCKMAFIVVSKRINTRYFVNDRNPAPGTVVDDVITLPERYDFFLVSQSVNQGTVSPTSYNIISDNIGLSADKLQILTYKMTHMYYNWAGTCRVPAVCQYAHKLAFLVAESIHRAPSNQLENQLYFL